MSNTFDEIDAKCFLLGIEIVLLVVPTDHNLWKIVREKRNGDMWGLWSHEDSTWRWRTRQEALDAYLTGQGSWS